jgi:hypothetical protein
MAKLFAPISSQSRRDSLRAVEMSLSALISTVHAVGDGFQRVLTLVGADEKLDSASQWTCNGADVFARELIDRKVAFLQRPFQQDPGVHGGEMARENVDEVFEVVALALGLDLDRTSAHPYPSRRSSFQRR